VQLGRRLSQAREQQGVSQSDLADRLRIGAAQLDALESGDRERLREPVFVIAQAKRVAGALGIDIEEQLADLRRSDLMAGTPHPGPAKPRSVPKPAQTAGKEAGEAPRSRRLLPVLLAGVAVLAAAIGLPLMLQSPGPESSVNRPSEEGSPPAEPVAGSGAAPASTPSPPASPPPGAKAGALLLEANGTSWVEVRDAAGATLFRGSLSGPRSFPLGDGLQVLAGRPDLVTVTVGDQKPQTMGSISEIRWRRFPAQP
jgi:transcriptional regulator with XRE-family HTH domain